MILVTGGSGFVGQHLVRYLSAQGLPVRALYNSHRPGAAMAQLPGVEWLRCDLLDVFEVEEAMAGITDVYHCAAIVSFDPAMRDEMLHFNPESTANLVDQALVQGIRKMVYVSSVAALGRTADAAKEITEEEEWGESRYSSAYALSKYLAETEVWRGIGEGMSAVIINPGIILGEGNWDSGSARLIKIAHSELPFYTAGSGAWVDVADVVHAMVLLMAAAIDAERFIMSEGNYSFRQVFTLMAAALHKKPPRYRAGAFITGITWRLSMLRHSLTGGPVTITRETAKSAQSTSVYNNSKLLRALPGFAYTPLAATIQRMAAAYLQGTQQ